MPSFFRRSGTALANVFHTVAVPSSETGVVKVYSRIVYGIAQLFARTSDGLEYQLTPSTVGSLDKGAYGDGSDGVVTVVGSVTLARDMYYEQLTVAPGAVLETASYRIWCRTSLVNEGTIRNNGGAGGTPTAGAAVAVGSLRRGGGGGAGSTTFGSAGGFGPANNASCPVGYTGGGGAGGGASGGGGGTGGAGAAAATISAVYGDARSAINANRAVARGYNVGSTGPTDLAIRGGGGGGGGDGAGGLPGGGGGGGGGIIVLVARSIDNSAGAIEARGGDGGPGSANCGGGGGGAGGVVYLVTDSYAGGLPDVSGGAAGAGTGAGTPAQAGTVGLVIGPIPG